MRCCQEMFAKWLETEENASWNQLLETLRSSSVNLTRTTLAQKIEGEVSWPSKKHGKEVNNYN